MVSFIEMEMAGNGEMHVRGKSLEIQSHILVLVEERVVYEELDTACAES